MVLVAQYVCYSKAMGENTIYRNHMEVLNWQRKMFQPESLLNPQLSATAWPDTTWDTLVEGGGCDQCIWTPMMKLFRTWCWYSLQPVRLACLWCARFPSQSMQMYWCLLPRALKRAWGGAGWWTCHDTYIKKKSYERKSQEMMITQKRTIWPSADSSTRCCNSSIILLCKYVAVAFKA